MADCCMAMALSCIAMADGCRAAADGWRSIRQRRLRGRQAGNRDSEWRTRHVVEPQLMTQRDAARLAAVLSADPDLERRTHAATVFHGHSNELPDARRVEHAEWVVRQDSFL